MTTHAMKVVLCVHMHDQYMYDLTRHSIPIYKLTLLLVSQQP